MSKPTTMSFLSSGVFWGVIIILLGLSIILREVFHIHLPFMRVLFGILLIYWGIRVISGGFFQSWRPNPVSFNQSRKDYDSFQKEYNIVFDHGHIDLFKMEMPTENKNMEVNVVFGHGELLLNDSIPVFVEMNTVFGKTKAPDQSTNAFGTSTFATPTYAEGKPCLKIKANTVFGNLEIRSKRW